MVVRRRPRAGCVAALVLVVMMTITSWTTITATSLTMTTMMRMTTSLVLLSSVHALTAPAPQPHRRHGHDQRNPLSFQEFDFAPNGVCLHPAYFVDTGGTSNNNCSSSNNNSNNNNNDDDDDDYSPVAAATTVSTSVSSSFFTMRNVPGEGDCMFLAVALASMASLGLGANDALLRAISRETRAVVAQVLGESPPGTLLYISGGDGGGDGDNTNDTTNSSNNLVEASRLLQSATVQEGMPSTEAYLEALRKEGRDGGLYGGGPELAVLANVLRRPIAIYEADNDANLDLGNMQDGNDDYCFPITCKGVFGDGLFEDPCDKISNSAILSGLQPGAYSWRLHILVLDVGNGEKHACVLLPQQDIERNKEEAVAATTTSTRP